MLRDPRAPRSGEFFAPMPIAALALLVANDVWLKPTFHNLVTGKLSDAAICLLMPLFVSELLGLSLAITPRVRLAFGALFTAISFTLLEVASPVTSQALRGLEWLGPYLRLNGGFAMTADPTDLLCVPLVLVAYRYGLTRIAVRPGVGSSGPGPSFKRWQRDVAIVP